MIFKQGLVLLFYILLGRRQNRDQQGIQMSAFCLNLIAQSKTVSQLPFDCIIKSTKKNDQIHPFLYRVSKALSASSTNPDQPVAPLTPPPHVLFPLPSSGDPLTTIYFALPSLPPLLLSTILQLI